MRAKFRLFVKFHVLIVPYKVVHIYIYIYDPALILCPACSADTVSVTLSVDDSELCSVVC